MVQQGVQKLLEEGAPGPRSQGHPADHCAADRPLWEGSDCGGKGHGQTGTVSLG